MSFTLVGGTPLQGYQAQSGTQYAADINGKVTSVALLDLPSLLGNGLRLNDSTLNPSANGLYATALPLTQARNSDGNVLAAAAASGKFGQTVTLGTTTSLVTEAANSSTKTDIALFDIILPRTYVAGQNVTVTLNTAYTLGSGTVGTHTLDAEAFLIASDGTSGSDLVSTSAATVPAAAADVTHTITGTTLLPGSRLVLRLTLVIVDSGGSNITANINSVRLS